MKEFEKYDEQYCDRLTCLVCLSLDIYCKHCEELRKRGWRAAMEHVLFLMENTTMLYTHIHAKIREELQND